MNRMKAAIVGCGMISRVYVYCIREQFSILELTACADLDEGKRNSLAQECGLRAMTTQEVMADPSVELVINLTNPSAHYAVTKEALLAGKHVYSEKVLADTFEGAKELCRTAQERSLRLGCAPDTFLGCGLQTARYAVDHGLIGTVQSGVISLSKDYRVFGEWAPHLLRRGGSILCDMGPYYLTALCSILGKVVRVTAFSRRTEAAHEVRRVSSPMFGQTIELEEDNIVSAMLEFAQGALVTLHFNANTIRNETCHLELYGDQGILYLSNPDLFDGEIRIRKVGNEEMAVPKTHGFRQNARGIGAAELAWAHQGGRPHRCSMEMALHVVEILTGIQKSAASGTVYSLTTSFALPAPLPEGFVGTQMWESGEETALL